MINPKKMISVEIETLPLVTPIVLDRAEDETGISGTGVVWEGCLFANGWVAGKWKSKTPSYGFYLSYADLIAIHGHEGKTKAYTDESMIERVFQVVTDAQNTTDGNPLVGEGVRFLDGWCVLYYYAKVSSVFWYQSEEHLKVVAGKRSQVLFYPEVVHPHKDILKREKIFR